MHAQLKTLKRAQKEGIEVTERLGGMVSREAIQQAPSRQSERRDASVTARSAGPTTLEGDMRSVLTGDSDEDEIHDGHDGQHHPALSEPPSISSLGQILPSAGPTRRGPGSSDFSGGIRGPQSNSAPLSHGSSPKTAGKAREPPHSTQQTRPSSIPSVPSSKPLPHRPFSRTEDDIYHDADERSAVGTDIIEEEIEMDGDHTPSISFIPRNATGGLSDHGARARYGDHLSEAPSSPRSHTGGIPPPPIQVSQSARARSQRTGRSNTPASQHSIHQSQNSGKRRSEQQPPPDYQYSNMPEPWQDIKDWKEGVKEKERMLFGDEQHKETYREGEEDDSMQADADLLAAFNRVVNLNSASRGEMIDQRAEPHGGVIPESPEYPHRAYQAPPETLSKTLGIDNANSSGLARSGSAPGPSAQQYRQNQSRSRPPRGESRSRSTGPRPTNTDTTALPLTEHELDEPVNPVSTTLVSA